MYKESTKFCVSGGDIAMGLLCFNIASLLISLIGFIILDSTPSAWIISWLISVLCSVVGWFIFQWIYFAPARVRNYLMSKRRKRAEANKAFTDFISECRGR